MTRKTKGFRSLFRGLELHFQKLKADDLRDRGQSSDNFSNNASERISSPDESSLSSKSSRRPGTEMSQQIRQRIRQQAKSMVEKKRGSVQLPSVCSEVSYKMLQVLLSALKIIRWLMSESPLGSKYVVKDQLVVAPSNIRQFFFFGKDMAHDLDEEMTPPLLALQRNHDVTDNLLKDVDYSKPTNTTKTMSEKFGSYLVQYNRKDLAQLEMGSTIQDPFALLDSQFFAARPPRDFSILVQRIGDIFLDNTGGLRGVENVVTIIR
uniref:Uncharacterized protein n=1 Tax=Ditylenchus dipsaci TaxID=166011 RepID=A0A915EFL8_9BILA